MKVFLTGATGVIGRPTVTGLIAGGHTVRAVARSEDKAEQLRHAGAEPVAVDLFDAAAVKDAVAGSEAVVHIATNVPSLAKMARPKGWEMHNRLRTEATRNLVDAARASGIHRFVKESVTFVYADGGDRWLDEESPLLPDLGLLAPTIDGENIALELAADGPDAAAVVLRFGLFYGGAGNRATDEMLKLAKVRSSMLAGNPDAYMSSIHADDAGAAVVAALAVPTGIYNVTDDESLTRREVLAAFAAEFHRHTLHTTPGWLVKIAAGPASGALVNSQRVSNRKFRAAAGWAPRFPSAREGWAYEARRRSRGVAEPGAPIEEARRRSRAEEVGG
jgi:nucleoside-diphosphate-sugar epimerase